MLLHASNNILVKKLFGNDLVGRFSYISLTINIHPEKTSWKVWGVQQTCLLHRVDYCKAFDSVWRTELWRTLRHYGYPEKTIRILEGIYKETFSAVIVTQFPGKGSEQFTIHLDGQNLTQVDNFVFLGIPRISASKQRSKFTSDWCWVCCCIIQRHGPWRRYQRKD